MTAPSIDLPIRPIHRTEYEALVHREPRDGTYASVTLHRDGIVRPMRAPDVAVDVRSVLS